MIEGTAPRERSSQASRPPIPIVRSEAVRLAGHIDDLTEHLKANEKHLDELVKASEAAPLLKVMGFSAISAARCLTGRSH